MIEKWKTPIWSGKTSARLYRASAFLSGIVLFSVSSLFTLPLIDGWFNFPLGSKSYFPYRDYYYPVPPLTFFEAQIVSNFSQPALMLRILHILLGGFFTLSLYQIASNFSKKATTLTITIFVSAILSTLRLEPAGGWNTQSVMFSVVGLAFFTYGWQRKDFTLQIGLMSGIFFFLGIITKQTVLFPFATLIFWSTLIGIKRKNNSILHFVGSIVAVQIIGSVLLTIYLMRNSAFNEFLNSILTSGGKNLELTDLSRKTIIGIIENTINYRSFLLLILISLHSFKYFHRKIIYQNELFTGALILLSVNIFSNLNEFNQVLTGVTIFLLFFFSNKSILLRNNIIFNSFLLVIIPISIGIINTMPVEPNLIAKLKNYALINGNLQQFWITIGIYLVFNSLKKFSIHKNCSEKKDIEFFLGSYVASNIVFAVLSSGGGYFVFWFIPILIIGIPRFISETRKSVSIHSKLSSVVSMLIVVASTLLLNLQTIVTPYSWWGWNSPSITTQNRVTIEDGYYKGLVVTQDQDILMKQIAEYEMKAAKLSTIRPTTLYSFPNISMTQSLTSMTNYTGLNCVIAWFDLCPNQLAASDLMKLSRKPPSVVVWSQPGEDVFLVHEELFLKQKSVLRNWSEYRNAQVKSGSWKLIGQIPPSTMNWWPIEIYAVVSK